MDSKKLVCHSLMLIGLAYLLGTRYLIYIHSPELVDLELARAAGANVSYFVIFTLAYWLSFTSRLIITNSIIGLICVIASPAIMPLIGYFGLIVMAIVRYFGNKKKLKQLT